jgi:opacity protein-like surface antigen
MKTKIVVSMLLTGASLATTGVALAAQGPTPGPYFRAEIGHSWSRDAEIRDNNFATVPVICGNVLCTVPGRLDDIGDSWVFGAGVGYRVNPNIRAELALGYRSGFELDQSDPQAPPSTFRGEIRNWNVMLNGYYDIDFGQPWKPYVGAGIGYARNKLRTITVTNPSVPGVVVPIAGDTDSGLAWSLGVGVGYALPNGMTLDVGYRYIDLGDLKVPALPVSVPSIGPAAPYAGAEGKLRAHELVLSLRF